MVHGDGVDSRKLVLGIALIASSFFLALLTTSLAWGGVLQMPLAEQAIWFSPAIVSFVAGSTLALLGLRRVAYRRTGA